MRSSNMGKSVRTTVGVDRQVAVRAQDKPKSVVPNANESPADPHHSEQHSKNSEIHEPNEEIA